MSAVYQRSPARVAFTMIELLIVLGLLAALVAFSWPAIGGMQAKGQLRIAAKQVRAMLAQARLEALESGTVRQFRYEPGTGRFEITAAEADGAAHTPGTAALSAAAESAPNTLPAGVRFETPSPTAAAADAGLPAESLDATWSAPLLFFPNGRTSNARLRLQGQRDFTVQLTLRGVTGAVAIGPLARVTERP